MAMFSTSARQPGLRQVMIASPDGTGSPPPQTVEGVAKAKHADPLYVELAYVVVAAGMIIGAFVVAARNPQMPKAVAGVNVFAALYVAAQAIERVLEPIREWLGDPLNKVSSPTEDAAQGNEPDQQEQKGKQGKQVPHAKTRKGASKSDLRYVRSLAIMQAREETEKLQTGVGNVAKAKEAADVAAAAQAAVEEERANSAVIMWALASFLGVLISAFLGLGLLHTVGVQDAPKWLDVVVTGLAIGGGTKPLHDLIGNLQASKDNKTDPADVKQS